MKNVFDETAVKFARDIDSDMALGKYIRGKLFVELAEQAVPAGGRILDYGCGPGRLGLLLARSGFRICGVDTAEGMIVQARLLDRRGLDIEFEVIRSVDDIFRPGSYDAIVCSSVIEYVSDPRQLLRGLHRALRQSGVLIISYANKSSLYRWTWRNSPNPMAGRHHHVWDWRGFRTLLVENGFRVIGRPKFFESPFDRGTLGRLVRSVPLFGSLGIIAARREGPVANES